LQSIGKLIIGNDGTIFSETITEVPEPSNKTGVINVTRSKANRWVDEEMYNFINDIWKEYEDELNIVVGKSDYDLIIKPEENSDSHSIYCRYQECTVGNLITDAVTEVGKADCTIINGGSVRNNMKTGNLTRNDIINTLPWFNNIVIKKLKGQTIYDALEFGVRNYPSSSGGFPQVSGITFDLNPTINSTVNVDRNGVFINITGERRVSNIKVNGDNLDLNKIYNVSLLEYTANGGDGYSMFSEYEVDREALMTDTDALDYYIGHNLNGIIPEKYAKLQGRINIVNGTNDENVTNDENGAFNYFTKKSSNKGLSAGGIIAIIICSIVALICVTALAFLCKGKGNSFQIDNTGSNINFKNYANN